jgi:hypothetical protein
MAATYHPQKWAHMLVFEGGCCLLPPPWSTLPTLKNEHACSFSRLVVFWHPHHPQKQAQALVFKGSCCLATLTSKMSTHICFWGWLHHHHLPSPSKMSTYAHFQGFGIITPLLPPTNHLENVPTGCFWG